MSAVVVAELSRSFGPAVAVDGASWDAAAGAVTALLGPNGAGKTTTIGCLVGLDRPDSGSVRVLGVDPWRAGPQHRARIGVMLQDGGLPNTATPTAVLRHLARLVHGPARVDELTERLGIDAFAHTAVRRLSGGQRQRVALAAALLAGPDVAFLDEPTSGLDPHTRRDVWALLSQEAQRGAGLVVTTHSFDEAERIADHVVIMAAGRTVAAGSVAEIRGDTTLEEAYFTLTDAAGAA